MATLSAPANATLLSIMTPSVVHTPVYFVTGPSLLPSLITDKHLSLAAPIVCYWAYSLLFHAIDCAQIPYFEKRRIHEAPEVLSRNRATVWDVLKAVAIQQIIQTLLGYFWLESEEVILAREVYRDFQADMAALVPGVMKTVVVLLGKRTGEQLLRSYGADIVQWVYWWGIPIAQFAFAFFLIDTWQYFLHRLFHTSRFLYRHFHSVHHRLYVPFAFGALYNHPVEGLLLDTLGAVIAHSGAGMTIRQAALLFAFSSLKTVDDHCGYKLWFDPFQMFFANTSDYHDIHHQAFGIKRNFSQPFFTNWDRLLGTHMSREEAATRTRKAGAKLGSPPAKPAVILSSKKSD